MFRKKKDEETIEFEKAIARNNARIETQASELKALSTRLEQQNQEIASMLDTQYPCKWRYKVVDNGPYSRYQIHGEHYGCGLRDKLGCESYLYIYKTCRECKERS